MTPVFPLWGKDTRQLAEEMVEGGLSAYLTCVDPRQLDRKFAAAKTESSILSRARDQCSARKYRS